MPSQPGTSTARTVVYWITTGLVALAFLSGGIAYLLGGDVQEWAYAGIAFDLTGAAFSHIAVGHPPAKVAVPLILLAVAATSWALRPGSRTLASSPSAGTHVAPGDPGATVRA